MKDAKLKTSGDEIVGEAVPSAEAGDANVKSNGGGARMERIAAYINESIRRSDGLEANLGVANGELMQLASRVTESLQQILARDRNESVTSDRCYPALDVLLRVHRQIDRYSQLEVKLRGQREARED